MKIKSAIGLSIWISIYLRIMWKKYIYEPQNLHVEESDSKTLWRLENYNMFRSLTRRCNESTRHINYFKYIWGLSYLAHPRVEVLTLCVFFQSRAQLFVGRNISGWSREQSGTFLIGRDGMVTYWILVETVATCIENHDSGYAKLLVFYFCVIVGCNYSKWQMASRLLLALTPALFFTLFLTWTKYPHSVYRMDPNQNHFRYCTGKHT